MSEHLINNIQDMLNEEKWTRTNIADFSISNLENLDQVISKCKEAEIKNELQLLCHEHLETSRDSIIALYLGGILSLSKRLIDDSNLVSLCNMFTDIKKWNIVQYICERILSYGENKFALRTLADAYLRNGDESSHYQALERLIKVDFKDADTVRKLAQHRETEGDLQGAVRDYRKAIHRYINGRQLTQIKQIWKKLVELQPDDLEGLLQIESKAVKAIGGDRSATLLESLYPHYRELEDWDATVEILKRILQHDPRNNGARSELVDVYRQRHESHSRLEEYIKLSNITQSWRNVHDAISDFEKHINFDEGNFVFHNSWGLGKIKKIEDDQFTIDFLKKRGHKMSLKMAVSALSILERNHIWVLRATIARDKLKKQIKSDPVWALKIIIKSFSNSTDMKRVKNSLVPSILTASEWTKWSMNARKILKTNPSFATVSDTIDHYSVRKRPVSFEEKTLNQFRADTDFFGRVRSLYEYLDNAEPESEYLGEMFQYFVGCLKMTSGPIQQAIASYIIVNKLTQEHPYLDPGIEISFPELYADIEEIQTVYTALDDATLSKSFLDYIKEEIDSWPNIYASVFLFQPSKAIIDQLNHDGHEQIVEKLSRQIVSDYRSYPRAFVWLVRNETDLSCLSAIGTPIEKILIGMLHLMGISFRDIENKRNTTDNRRINRQISDYIFKEKHLGNFLSGANRDSIHRIYTLVDDIKELDPAIKLQTRQQVKDRFPDYEFTEDAELTTVRRGLLVTRRGYENRQRELRHILEVDIPDNSREIGVALQQGDLRENAEYKAALERQELLKNNVSRLQEDLQNAQIFNLSETNDATISFGTHVNLTNLLDDSLESYTILGPWESDPDNNVISYLSPLAAKLWNHKIKDQLKFSINDKEFSYRIENINRAIIEDDSEVMVKP